MSKKRIFPIDKIKKNAKVVLYGAGKNGRELINLNNQLSWCNIFLTVDINYEMILDFPTPLAAPEILTHNKNYDYVLISILDELTRKKVFLYLISMGIDTEKIIDEIDVYLSREKTPIMEDRIADIEEPLTIGFLPGGVMGDNVISLRLYQELIKLAPNSKIDVFTSFEGFPEHVFYHQKNLRKIIHRLPNEEDKKVYDVLLQSHFEPSLIYCNIYRVRHKCMELAERLSILYEYQKKDFFMCTPAQYMNRLQWDRAKFKGYSCYTILGSSGAFDIADYQVDFLIDSNYEKRFNELELDAQYITFNYGASDPLKDGKVQTKVWPIDYHEKLNHMIKGTIPNIQLVQLGASDVTRVSGADRYIFGENLEVTKYVLKNAICHIDCEGGLVHIASQLGTKCFVLFGPTPVSFFGYDVNENIVSKDCKECCGLVADWYTRCYKYEIPKCMRSIKPEEVFGKLKVWLDSHI